MDKYRWVVEKVRVACELDDRYSVIHPSLFRTSGGKLILYGNVYPAGKRFSSHSYDIIKTVSCDGGETWSSPEKAFTKPFRCGTPTYAAHGHMTKSGRMVCFAFFSEFESGDDAVYHVTDRISPYGAAVKEVTGGGHGISGETRPIISDDEGVTWHAGEPVDVMGYCGGGAVTEFSDGRLILPVYGFRNETDMEYFRFSNGYISSEDGGNTWGRAMVVAPFDEKIRDMPNEMAVVELPDGRWIALYRDQFFRDSPGAAGIYIFRSYSYDKGNTWTTGQQIFPLMGYTSAALLPDDALMIIGHSMQGIFYAVSNDHGGTWDYMNTVWSYDMRLGGDCGGFSIVPDEDRIMIAYYAKSDRSKDVLAAADDRYGKMRLEIAWLKKAEAESTEGRMR